MRSLLSSISCLVAVAFASELVQNRSCPVGAEHCSKTISEDSSDSVLGKLYSIVFNQKQNISSYKDRLSDEVLTERDTTNEYYDLATDFYEYGWGSSFHFAARHRGESLAESIKRHEHFLALKLGLTSGHQVADLGMGVGGPLRAIAKFSGASVTGVTINDYQVRRARKLTQQRESLASASRMQYVQGDFTKLVPEVFRPESLDACYYIESACHISNRTEVFSESARALRSGGRLFTFEWVMTDRYDPTNAAHVEIKKGIEYGNGIEDLVSYKVALSGLEASGFRILEHGDLVDIAEEWYGDANVPWYFDMGRYYAFGSFQDFRLSQFGQLFLNKVLWFVSKIGLVPQDALETEKMLRHGGMNLVAGGRSKIFTPMYYILAEKI